MNKSYTYYIAAFFFILIINIGCSELKNDLPQEPELTVHKEGILDQNSPDFHGNVIRNAMWDMRSCKQCHASDYSGGTAGASCLTCHDQLAGPENCSTCHGSSTSPAPPRDLNGNTLTSAVGVGAHQVHLGESSIIKTISCTQCHVVPENVYQSGHVDSGSPAEITFGFIPLTNLGINSAYDNSTATCSNTYCHGNWEFSWATSRYQSVAWLDSTKMTGNNQPVIWNEVDGTQAECGTCHGLPPEGHISYPINLCGSCHSGIVDTDGNIVDSLKYKHINGLKNVFGDEY